MVPHDGQNAASLGSTAPHVGQLRSSDAPQRAQKRASAGFSCPHAAQSIALSNHVPFRRVRHERPMDLGKVLATVRLEIQPKSGRMPTWHAGGACCWGWAP